MRDTDVADVVYTSGTTGKPKGVMMNHRQTLRLYAEWCDLADLRAGDRYLLVNPFFHTFGYKAGLVASLIRGATMLPVRVFDVPAVLDLIERERVTMLPGPPTLYHSLLQARGGGHDLSSLRAAVTGAADIPVDRLEPGTDGRLQGAAVGGVPGCVTPECHREGEQGSAALADLRRVPPSARRVYCRSQ